MTPTLNDTYFSKILPFSYASVYLPKLCHIRKKSLGRLSKALLSILESSCYGSEKLSELYFFMCEYHWEYTQMLML